MISLGTRSMTATGATRSVALPRRFSRISRGAHPRTPLRLEPLERKRDFVDAIRPRAPRAEEHRSASPPRSVERLRRDVREREVARGAEPPRVAIAPDSLREGSERPLPRVPVRTLARSVLRADVRRPCVRALGTKTVSTEKDFLVSESGRRRGVRLRRLRTGGRVEYLDSGARFRAVLDRPRVEPMIAFDPSAPPRPSTTTPSRTRTTARSRTRACVATSGASSRRRSMPFTRSARVGHACSISAAEMGRCSTRSRIRNSETGVGVDPSRKLVEYARTRAAGRPCLSFERVASPSRCRSRTRLFRRCDLPVNSSVTSTGYPDARRDSPRAHARRTSPRRRGSRARERLLRSPRLASGPRERGEAAPRFRTSRATSSRSSVAPHGKLITEQNPLRAESEVRCSFLASRFPSRGLVTLATEPRSGSWHSIRTAHRASFRTPRAAVTRGR